MSLKEKTLYTCEYCNKDFEIDTYKSINVSLDPELREKILKYKIYSFECPHCKQMNFYNYTFLYHDMKNNFMINTGTEESLMDFYYSFINNNENSFYNDFPKLKEVIKHVGVTSYDDLISNIVMLENGIDTRIGSIYCFFERLNLEKSFKESENTNFHELKVVNCYFDYENDKMVTRFVIMYENGTINRKYSSSFNQENYDYLKKHGEEVVDEMYPYVFDDNLVDKTIDILFEDLNKEELRNNKFTVALLELANGLYEEALIPTFNENKFNVGDIVIIRNKDKYLKGRINHIINTDELYFPYSKESLPVALFKSKNVELTTTKNSTDILENKELKELLYDSDYRGFNKLFDSDVILTTKTLLLDNKYLNGFDEIPFNATRTRIITTLENDENYINIYLESDEIKDNAISKNIYNFKDIFKLILNNPEEFDGIIFDYDITFKTLNIKNLVNIFTGIIFEKEIKEYVSNLKEEERKYFSELELKYLISHYINNDEDLSEFVDISDKAREKLKNIMLSNYLE